jgi:hypothetical protein
MPVFRVKAAAMSFRPALLTTGGASIWISARAAPMTKSDSKTLNDAVRNVIITPWLLSRLAKSPTGDTLFVHKN